MTHTDSVIRSSVNPLLKAVRRAVRQRSPTPDGFAAAEGPHLLEEAYLGGAELGAILVAEKARPETEAIVARLPPHAPLRRVAADLFATVASTETSQGVVTLVRLPERSLKDCLALGAPIIALDRVQDPGNVGTILRAAEAFGASGAVLLKGSASPFNPKTLRASAGSLFRLPFAAGVRAEKLVTAAREAALTLLALSSGKGEDVSEIAVNEGAIFVIGSEAQGVGTEILEVAMPIRIPTRRVESLNAAMAATVVLYEAARQREAER